MSNENQKPAKPRTVTNTTTYEVRGTSEVPTTKKIGSEKQMPKGKK
jgi:hypothetical protein